MGIFNTIKSALDYFPTIHFRESRMPQQVERKAEHFEYDKILNTLNNDREMFSMLMVHSISELKVVLACYGLEHVPENIAPIVLLEFWHRRMPRLVQNLSSKSSCFKLTAEQKEMFKKAYPALVRQEKTDVTLYCLSDQANIRQNRKCSAISRRRLKTLDKMYTALGISH